MKSTTLIGLYAGLCMTLPSLVRAEPGDAFIAPPTHTFDSVQQELATFAAERHDVYEERKLPAAGTFQQLFKSPTLAVADLGTVIITYLHTVDPSIGRMRYDPAKRNTGITDELRITLYHNDGTMFVCHDYSLDGWQLTHYNERDNVTSKALLPPDQQTLNSLFGSHLAQECHLLNRDLHRAFRERRYRIVSGGT